MKGTSLRFRTPDDSDVEWATAVYNAANPDAPRDLSFTRWLWAITDEDWGERRYVVELDRQPLGWLMLDHVVWNRNPGRFAGVDPWLHPKLQTRPRLDEIFGLIEHDAREMGAAVLTTGVREIAPRMIRVLLRRGYSKVGTERYWELDLIGPPGSSPRDRSRCAGGDSAS